MSAADNFDNSLSSLSTRAHSLTLPSTSNVDTACSGDEVLILVVAERNMFYARVLPEQMTLTFVFSPFCMF